MSTSKGANTYNRQNWEESDFPLLCKTCLGDNPYVRMIKEKHEKECKTCNTPFTVFKWCPGARMRFKKTEVCQTCRHDKNICQSCLSGLENGLPVQVRDAAIRVQDSDVNKEYYMLQKEKEIENIDGTNPVGALATKAKAPSDMLLKLARTSPYYKRNIPHICPFWVKGECKRGEECPYRHEKPTDPDDPLADQNIRDRFYGTNDPVADKLLRRYLDMPKLEPPEDKNITTLYIGGLGEKVDSNDLKIWFYQFGEIRSVKVVQKQQCAFVQFTNRQSAEVAAERSFSRLIIKGQRLAIKWGYPPGQQQSMKKGENEEEEMVQSPQALTMPPKDNTKNYFNLPPPPMMPPFMFGGEPMSMKLSGVGSSQNQNREGALKPSRGLLRRPRESGGVVKPFGAGLKNPSLNPNRASLVKPTSDEICQDPNRASLVKPTSDEICQDPNRASLVKPTSDEICQDPNRASLMKPTSDEICQDPNRASVMKPTSDEICQDPNRASVVKPTSDGTQQSMKKGENEEEEMVQSPPALTMPPKDTTKNYFNLPAPVVVKPSGAGSSQNPNSGSVVKPFGSGLKYPSQDPNREGVVKPFGSGLKYPSQNPNSGSVVKPFGGGLKYPSQNPNSGSVVKPFGGGLKYPSQNPNSGSVVKPFGSGLKYPSQNPNSGGVVKPFGSDIKFPSQDSNRIGVFKPSGAAVTMPPQDNGQWTTTMMPPFMGTGGPGPPSGMKMEYPSQNISSREMGKLSNARLQFKYSDQNPKRKRMLKLYSTILKYLSQNRNRNMSKSFFKSEVKIKMKKKKNTVEKYQIHGPNVKSLQCGQNNTLNYHRIISAKDGVRQRLDSMIKICHGKKKKIYRCPESGDVLVMIGDHCNIVVHELKELAETTENMSDSDSDDEWENG